MPEETSFEQAYWDSMKISFETGPRPEAEFNVLDFGADPSGGKDSTAEIQSALDAATGPGDPKAAPRIARKPVYLPSGSYQISKPLRIWSVQGLKFHGDGFASRLMPVGKLDAVLDLNGVGYSVFEGFSIQGAGQTESVTNAIQYHWDRSTSYASSTANVFRDITIANVRCVNGFAVGLPGEADQVDNTSYTNIYLAGVWQPGEATWYQAGFRVGSGVHGNILGHSAYNVTSSFWAAGILVDATNYAQWGGAFGRNGTDLKANTLAYFTIQGVRSESSVRFFESIGPSSNDALYNLSDVVWAADRLAADGQFIKMTSGGHLRVTNLQIVNGGSAAKVSVRPPTSATVRLSGVSAQCGLDRLLDIGPNVTAITEGCFAYSDAVGRVSASEGLTTSGPVKAGALDLGNGRAWNKDGLFLSPDRHWTDDGLYPGVATKWFGSGGLQGTPDGGLRWVDWKTRRERVVAKPNR